MLKETDLDSVRSVVRAFLYMEPEKTEFPFIVSHPIFNVSYIYLPECSKAFDIYNEQDLKYIRTKYNEIIHDSTLLGLYMVVRDCYKLAFLKHCMKYLSLEDYSKLLADAWVSSENPNQDVNCPIPLLIKMFRKADKKMLMTEEDYKIYNSLPQSVHVYRGVAVGRNPEGLSWTDDFKKAEWFANRFNNREKTGYIETTTVKKSQVLAYFNTRNEKELVCDIRKSKIERL